MNTPGGISCKRVCQTTLEEMTAAELQDDIKNICLVSQKQTGQYKCGKYSVLHITKEEFKVQGLQDETNSNECHSFQNVTLWLDRMLFLELQIRKSFYRILDYTDIILFSAYPLIPLNIPISIPFSLHMYIRRKYVECLQIDYTYTYILSEV